MKKILKNMIVTIDTPPIDIHKYCLVNWLYTGITLTALLDGTYIDEEGLNYEWNGDHVFETKNKLVNFHVVMITSKDLMKSASPYPVNILISAWLSPKGYEMINNELKEYEESVFIYNKKYTTNTYKKCFKRDPKETYKIKEPQYTYNSYLNNYIQYKKPVHEIKKYVILNKNKAVIRKWAQNFKDDISKKKSIDYYYHHGLKIHASCMKEIKYFYEMLNFNKTYMMRWLIFYKFLIPVER